MIFLVYFLVLIMYTNTVLLASDQGVGTNRETIESVVSIPDENCTYNEFDLDALGGDLDIESLEAELKKHDPSFIDLCSIAWAALSYEITEAKNTMYEALEKPHVKNALIILTAAAIGAGVYATWKSKKS